MEFERLISSDLYVEGPTPARYWGDQWLRVSEKVLKGLNQQLTNRVASVESAMATLAVGGKVDDGFVRAMAGEINRLHELMQLYRSLPAEPVAMPEPLRLQDLLPQAVRLHEHHSDLRDVSCYVTGDPDTEPVVVRHGALLRCVLVLMSSVAGNVMRSRSSEPMTIQFGMLDDEVYLRLAGPMPAGQLLFSGEGSLLHAVRAALAHANGEAEGSVRRNASGDVLEYELRLPSMTSARQPAVSVGASGEE